MTARDALQALVTKLKQMEQPVNNCIQYSELHGLPYTGPDWSGEMAVAEAALRESEDPLRKAAK